MTEKNSSIKNKNIYFFFSEAVLGEQCDIVIVFTWIQPLKVVTISV